MFVSSTKSSDHRRQDNNRKTSEVCERLIGESGPCANLYLSLGDAYSITGEVSEAAKAYSNALKLDGAVISHKRLHSFAVSLIEIARCKPEFLENMGKCSFFEQT